jgi:hypothetical protein
MSRTDLGDVTLRCRIYLVAKPSHVGVDVDRLACPLHHSMACRRGVRTSCQMRSCPVVSQWAIAPFRGMQSPKSLIFGAVLIVRVPVLSNLTWSKSFLPGDDYPISEPS